MSRRLYGLDAIRGLAALVVALHHLSVISGGRGLEPLPGLAVDLFLSPAMERIAAWLGLLSYPLYATHVPVLLASNVLDLPRALGIPVAR